jgi:putative transposase
MEWFKVAERRVCLALGIARSTARYQRTVRQGQDELVNELFRLSKEHPRFGYRRIWALLQRAGWTVNRKRVQRLWRESGLKVPLLQKKRRRNLGEPVRKRATKPNECWCYDFIFDQTEDGRTLKILTVLDEFTKECLAIRVGRTLNSERVVETLEDLFLTRGTPDFIRSDNGPEFIAEAVQSWLRASGVKTLPIPPGSPWENPFSESFHSRLRDELLNRESFSCRLEAKVVLDDYRCYYNESRPHSSLGYQTPNEVRKSLTSAA